MTDKRLIEVAFPLKQTSLDSVHEKNVRHGHISTLHIWPARRPLAACRAALIATLLPDPGTPEGRKALCEKIGGKVVKVVKRKKLPSGKVEDKVVEETVGGILHWGRETENKADVDWFREEIRKAYGGRAPAAGCASGPVVSANTRSIWPHAPARERGSRQDTPHSPVQTRLAPC